MQVRVHVLLGSSALRNGRRGDVWRSRRRRHVHRLCAPCVWLREAPQPRALQRPRGVAGDLWEDLQVRLAWTPAERRRFVRV